MNQEIKEVNPATAHQMITNGALLVDIREWEEIEMIAFDMEGQILLPQSEFVSRFNEIPIDRDIIVGCHSGKRSLTVALFLMQQDFDNVYSLKGGISDWEEMGFPVKWDTCIHEEPLQTNPEESVLRGR